MNASRFNFLNQNAKRSEPKEMLVSPLKKKKDSHFIVKSSPPPCSSSSSSSPPSSATSIASVPAPRPHHSCPVIIYTHSPKIIHTHPRDFMALVQKLTGLSEPEADNDDVPLSSPEIRSDHQDEGIGNPKTGDYEECESTSVVTDENGCGGGAGDSSCLFPPVFDNLNRGFNDIGFMTSNSVEFLRSAQPSYGFGDSTFFMPKLRSSFSSSTFECMKEFTEF